MLSTTLSAAALLAGLKMASAQTFTSCNPLDSTTCPSDSALGTTQNTDWTQGASSDWSLAAGTTLSYGANGAQFTINSATDAPTISSDKYIFFGKVEAVIKSAPGTGMVSSFILESDDLDEIDWEWLGSKDTSVESNFFGKGNTTTYDRALYHNVADPIGTWHTYTIDWTANYVKWSIDGNLVRTLNYADPLALYGKNFPQTPMKVKMGNWVGCANAAANQPSSPTYGTCQWAGGPADFTQAPFTMYVKSVTIQDYSCGSEYTYGDESGSWQSIKISGACNGSSMSAATASATASASSSSSSATASTSSASTSSASSASVSATSSASVASSASSAGSSTGTVSAQSSSTKPTVSGVSSAFKDGPTVATTLATASSSGGVASSSASSTAPLIVTGSAASSLTPKSKYGVSELTVIALGLTLGYFVM